MDIRESADHCVFSTLSLNTSSSRTQSIISDLKKPFSSSMKHVRFKKKGECYHQKEESEKTSYIPFAHNSLLNPSSYPPHPHTHHHHFPLHTHIHRKMPGGVYLSLLKKSSSPEQVKAIFRKEKEKMALKQFKKKKQKRQNLKSEETEVNTSRISVFERLGAASLKEKEEIESGEDISMECDSPHNDQLEDSALREFDTFADYNYDNIIMLD